MGLPPCRAAMIQNAIGFPEEKQVPSEGKRFLRFECFVWPSFLNATATWKASEIDCELIPVSTLAALCKGRARSLHQGWAPFSHRSFWGHYSGMRGGYHWFTAQDTWSTFSYWYCMKIVRNFQQLASLKCCTMKCPKVRQIVASHGVSMLGWTWYDSMTHAIIMPCGQQFFHRWIVSSKAWPWGLTECLDQGWTPRDSWAISLDVDFNDLRPPKSMELREWLYKRFG